MFDNIIPTASSTFPPSHSWYSAIFRCCRPSRKLHYQIATGIRHRSPSCCQTLKKKYVAAVNTSEVGVRSQHCDRILIGLFFLAFTASLGPWIQWSGVYVSCFRASHWPEPECWWWEVPAIAHLAGLFIGKCSTSSHIQMVGFRYT